MSKVYFTTQPIFLRICLVVLASTACLCCGCASIGDSKEKAERAVEIFHSQLDSERYSEIYTQGDEDFKKSGSEEEFDKLVRAVHQKLGNVQATEPTDYLVNATTGGTYVTLTYNTSFVHGKATEQFIWQ